MINDGNAGNAGQINDPGIAQISAKEFGAKFKSKRGTYSGALVDRHPTANDRPDASAKLMSGGGHLQWRVSQGGNLFRRVTNDSHQF